MTEVTQLVGTLKRQLKAAGQNLPRCRRRAWTCRSRASSACSAPGQFSLDRLVEVCNLLGFTLAELAQEANASESRLRTLTAAQEKELVSDPMLLLVAVCALNHWTMQDMLAAYRLSEAECLQRLLRLDRLHVISLLPGNRIRLNVSRDFDWLVDGPIRQYFREQGPGRFPRQPLCARG